MKRGLFRKFREQRKEISLAVKRIIKEVDSLVKESEGKISIDEMFGVEE